MVCEFSKKKVAHKTKIENKETKLHQQGVTMEPKRWKQACKIGDRKELESYNIQKTKLNM